MVGCCCVFCLTLPSSMSATPASGNFSMTSSTKSSSGHLFGACSGSSWYAGYPLATTVTSDLLWVLLFKVPGLGLRRWHTVVALTLGVPTRKPRAPLASSHASPGSTTRECFFKRGGGKHTLFPESFGVGKAENAHSPFSPHPFPLLQALRGVGELLWASAACPWSRGPMGKVSIGTLP